MGMKRKLKPGWEMMKPCPFCGGLPVSVFWSGRGYTSCEDCYAKTATVAAIKATDEWQEGRVNRV